MKKNNKEYFDKIRKPMAPPGFVMSSDKSKKYKYDHMKEYEEEEPDEFS
jgi:hypothetical protein